MRTLKFLIVLAIAAFVLLPPAASSQRTSVSRMFPVYDNGGKADLVADPQRFVSQMEIVDRLFVEGDCALEEGAVGALGYRRILRFDTVVINSGDGDLVVGNRADSDNPFAEFFEFAPCHGHFHIRDFSVYELLNIDRTLVVAAQKQGFCMEDSLKYDGGKSKGFDCAFQGITSGWGDWYFKQLTGQWIDITGVPEGDYIVRVRINTANTFDEGENRYTNSVETSIHVPNPRKKVSIDTTPLVKAK